MNLEDNTFFLTLSQSYLAQFNLTIHAWNLMQTQLFFLLEHNIVKVNSFLK